MVAKFQAFRNDPTQFGCDINALNSHLSGLRTLLLTENKLRDAHAVETFLMEVQSIEEAAHLHPQIKSSEKLRIVYDTVQALASTKLSQLDYSELKRERDSCKLIYEEALKKLAANSNEDKDANLRERSDGAMANLRAKEAQYQQETTKLVNYEFFSRLLKTFLQVQQSMLATFIKKLPDSICQMQVFKVLLYNEQLVTHPRAVAPDQPVTNETLGSITPDGMSPHKLPWKDFCRYHQVLYELFSRKGIKNPVELNLLRADLFSREQYRLNGQTSWQEWYDKVLMRDIKLLSEDYKITQRDLMTILVIHCEHEERFKQLCQDLNPHLQEIDDDYDISPYLKRFIAADEAYWRKEGRAPTQLKINAAGFYKPPGTKERANAYQPGKKQEGKQQGGKDGKKRQQQKSEDQSSKKKQKSQDSDSKQLSLPKDSGVKLLAVAISDDASDHATFNASVGKDEKVLFFDSGAVSWSLPQEPNTMTNQRTSNQHLIFANDQTLPIQTVGDVGEIKDVIICNGMTKSLGSVSKVARDMKQTCIFTGMGAYVLKPGIAPSFQQSDVAMYFKLKDGLYTAPVTQTLQRLGQLKKGK